MTDHISHRNDARVGCRKELLEMSQKINSTLGEGSIEQTKDASLAAAVDTVNSTNPAAVTDLLDKYSDMLMHLVQNKLSDKR